MSNIFVFGSNLAGIHGAGAAAYAVAHHGAIIGRGVGLQGTSYGIPTKDYTIRTLPLGSIARFIEDFKDFAETHSEMVFDVTRIGCGLAGFTDAQIAPLFINFPKNCNFPLEWAPWLGEGVMYHDLH